MKKYFIILMALLAFCACDKQNKPLKQFVAGEVTLLPGEFETRAEWDEKAMMELSVDRLVYFFLDKEHREGLHPYGSWEIADLRGHTLGHYLTAMSMLYAQKRDEEVLRRIETALNGMEECQERLGTGLITAFRLDLLDECETQGTGWAPYYTLHKILQGLLDTYQFTGSERALTMADRMGDNIVERVASIRERNIDWAHNLDIMEVGGFAEAMLNLYALTGKPEQLDAARFFHQWSKLQPMADGRDELNHPSMLQQHRNRRTPNDDEMHNMHHCNATIPQFLAAARDFEITGDSLYWKAASNFWDNVTEHRTYCNGTTGYFEHWNFGPDSLSLELGIKAGETCCTNNMIKLSNELFRLHPDARYAGYVERALVNDIMGTIQPETGNFMYFHTQEPGSFKTFGINDQCFWCCTGSGMENHQRYVESVYFTDGERLFVNQPIASRLDWREKGLVIKQESGFPLSGDCLISIEAGKADMTLAVRKPEWCKEYEISLNGSPVDATEEDGYICCRRKWNTGDKLSISMSMPLYTEPIQGEESIYAIFYGPMVLAADLGEADPSLIAVTDNFFNGAPEEYSGTGSLPVLAGGRDAVGLLRAGEHAGEFYTETEDGESIRLLPLYQVTDRRFSDYFLMKK